MKIIDDREMIGWKKDASNRYNSIHSLPQLVDEGGGDKS